VCFDEGMTLEDQVCSLDLARKLKKLGVKQNSAFWWEQVKIAGKNVWSKEWKLSFNNYSMPYDNSHITSAFTVAELGAMLPVQVETGEGLTGIQSELLQLTKGSFPDGNLWQVMYYDVIFMNAKTEADARAKMLIYLIEKNLIEDAA